MGNTTADKLKEMMEHYQNRVNHIDSVVNTLSYKLDELQDKKDLIETNTINPLITDMNDILSSLNKSGSLYKNNYYGVEDVQGWAWYKSLGYNAGDLIYVNDDTFYIMGYINDIKTGDYLLIKDSKYGYMERKAKRVDKEDGYTKVFLDKNVGALSNPISLQGPYLSHNDSFPTCVNGGGKMPARTDCCNFPDKNFDDCETVPTLVWKKIETEISGSGTQQLEVYGGLQPYTWWVENTSDFILDRNDTESTKNILTYNYRGTGSKISVTDYCGSYIEEEFMPQELEYLPGVFKIIIDGDVSYTGEKQPVTIKISRTTGRYNDDLSFVFDDIGEKWQKIYIQDSYPFNSGNTLYSSKHFWKPDEKIGLITFDADIKLYQKNIFYCFFGSELQDNEWITDDHFIHGNQATIFTNMYGKNGISAISKNVNISENSLDNSGQIAWKESSSNFLGEGTTLLDPRFITGDPNRIPYTHYFDYGYDTEYKSAVKINYDDPITYEVSLNPWINECDPGGSYTYPEPYRDYLKCYNRFGIAAPFDNRYLDEPPGENKYIHTSSTFTVEFFLYLNNMKESVDCWDKKSEFKDKWLYGNSGGDGYLGNWIKFSADNGALQFWNRRDWGFSRTMLLESKTKNWNGWTHIAFTHTWKEGILRMYIDGNLEDEANICEIIPDFCNESSYFYPFRFSVFEWMGSWYYPNNQHLKFLKTKVDETRLSHVQHSQERIKMHILDMKDELCYYEKIAKPSRS